MSSRAMSTALCAPACQMWFPRTLRAAPRTMWVAVGFRINASRRLGNGTLVPRRDAGIEVVRDFDRQVREFLDDVRIEAVAVVQLEEALDVEPLARGGQLRRDLPDRRPPLFERLPIPRLFDLQELQDVPFVEEELWIVLANLVDHEGHRVAQAVRDVQIFERAESPPDEEAREIALSPVRRDDAVSQEEDQRSRVVAHDV